MLTFVSPTARLVTSYQSAVIEGSTVTEAYLEQVAAAPGAPASKRLAAKIAAALTRRAARS